MAPTTSAHHRTPWTPRAIAALLERERFGYDRVELGHGLATPGADRSPSIDLVLPASLAGQTVLDIGCGFGSVSFEAERRGAESVTAVDIRAHRIRKARLLGDAQGSHVDFRQADVQGDDLGGPYDLVLMLNVLHHLREPLRALRQAAALTTGRLAIEFPTFADRTFLPNPPEQLYRISADRACLENLAGKPMFATIQQQHRRELDRILTAEGDPRATGNGDVWESYPRFSPMRRDASSTATRWAGPSPRRPVRARGR